MHDYILQPILPFQGEDGEDRWGNRRGKRCRSGKDGSSRKYKTQPRDQNGKWDHGSTPFFHWESQGSDWKYC